MPPSRRQMPPVRRRPKVAGAGIRRPSPSPRPQDEDYVRTEEIAAPEAPEAEAAPVAVPEEAAPRRPSPRPKARDTGEPKPASYTVAEAAAGDADRDEPDQPRPRRRVSPYVLAGALFGLALVLAGFAAWFKIEGARVDETMSNAALLDTARTADVSKAASNAVESLFSYDFNNIAKTQNAAKDLLVDDDARNTYNSLFGEVERLAPQQKMVVTVKATRSAVVMLDGDRAKVMVFVDQTSTRTDQNQTASGSAQLWLNMQYTGGQWKVSALDTYQAEQPSPAPAPSSAPPPASAPPPSR